MHRRSGGRWLFGISIGAAVAFTVGSSPTASSDTALAGSTQATSVRPYYESDLSHAVDLTLVGNTVWVTNPQYQGAIAMLTTSGARARQPILGRNLNQAAGVAVVGNHVWVTNNGSNTISVYNLDGSYSWRNINGNGLSSPAGIAVVGSQVWVSNGTPLGGGGNRPTNWISRFTLSGASAGSPLSGNGLNIPGRAVQVNSQVWVPNIGSASISRFTLGGAPAGSPLTGNGLANPAAAVVVGSQVWVTNMAANTISTFNQDGTSAGSPVTGTGDNQLQGPFGLAVIGSQVWVVNSQAAKISVFTAAAPAPDPIIGAAGNIACSVGATVTATACQQQATANILGAGNLSAVLPLGDDQYDLGSLSSFQSSYDPTWGRFKSITHPIIGNHEYGVPDRVGYFDYFNGVGNASGSAGARGQGYYSYNIGTWHLVALNSNCLGSEPGLQYNSGTDCTAESN